MRVALLTPPGRGALAVVGVAGGDAVRMVSRVFVPRGAVPIADRVDGAICTGHWGPSGEELVVVRRSDTSLEVHCHGGFAAADAVLASLESLGAVRQQWTDWLAAGGEHEIALEAREALSRVGGPKAARILSRQLAGLLGREIDRVRSLPLGPGDAGESGCQAAAEAVDRLLRAAKVGLRLTTPWRVVLAGSVNAGKSSLVNAVAGSPRSLVSGEPGTTRDVLETRIVIDGWEIDLVDTAGLRHAADAAGVVEREGIDRAIDAAASADLVLRVVDCRERWTVPSGDVAKRELLVLTKTDLLPSGRTAGLPGDGSLWPPAATGVAWTSALTGAGIDELLSAVVRRLVPEERHEPALLAGAVPFTRRQVALIENLRDTLTAGRRA